MVSLHYDDFYDRAVQQITAAGYVIAAVQRYEPTTLQGTTPKGVAFTYHIDADGWTATYRSKTLRGPADADWWTSSRLVQRFLETMTAAGG